MTFNITQGSVQVTINPAAALETVVAQPNNTSAVYATFLEFVQSSGLAKVIFEAFPAVAKFNTHADARIPWPTKYGTSDEPYGTPADPVTGVREVTLVDAGENVRRWTDAVHAASKSRKSFLDNFADLAVAVAAGIKSAMESHIRTGRVTVPAAINGASGTVIVEVPNMTGEVFLSTRGSSRQAYVNSTSQNGFVVYGDSLPSPFEVSWLVVG